VREKKPLEQIPAVADAIRAAEQQLDGNGRVVVRYSGTEPVARVMVEAEEQAAVTKFADSISAAIKKSIGA
jgi:phosphoglucosamine mutase